MGILAYFFLWAIMVQGLGLWDTRPGCEEFRPSTSLLTKSDLEFVLG